MSTSLLTVTHVSPEVLPANQHGRNCAGSPFYRGRWDPGPAWGPSRVSSPHSAFQRWPGGRQRPFCWQDRNHMIGRRPRMWGRCRRGVFRTPLTDTAGRSGDQVVNIAARGWTSPAATTTDPSHTGSQVRTQVCGHQGCDTFKIRPTTPVLVSSPPRP